jgi:Prephenate dehydrogenase
VHPDPVARDPGRSGDRHQKDVGAGRHAGRRDECRPSRQGAGGDSVTDLEDSLKSEVIEFSASGFRDFTRIAVSDPVMWRDIFLNNREAVLEILQRFNEDLTALQRAIRWGEGDKLQELLTRTRAIRRSIIEAKQA